MIKNLYIIILALLLNSCTDRNNEQVEEIKTINKPSNTIKLSSEIEWEKLNPARGDKSPQAGTIWGDRKGTEATGFLAKFVDGFSSPPHIHNVTYRAVVIKGLVHNDDPKAAKMWMPTGSFWTQPLGESHITAAKGEENIALVEIDNGPYLVHPKEQATKNNERPINIDASNVIWLNKNMTNWVNKNSSASISFLWKSNDSRGLFIKLPKSYNGTITTYGTEMHAVIIAGKLDYTLPQDSTKTTLDPGSYFGAKDNATHVINNSYDQDIVVYVRTNGNVKIN